MIKLTKVQSEVVDLLNKGWELGSSTPVRRGATSYWAQEGGMCKGGRVVKFKAQTIKTLVKKNVIKPTYRLPGDAYWLDRYELSTVINFKEELTT